MIRGNVQVCIKKCVRSIIVIARTKRPRIFLQHFFLFFDLLATDLLIVVDFFACSQVMPQKSCFASWSKENTKVSMDKKKKNLKSCFTELNFLITL